MNNLFTNDLSPLKGEAVTRLPYTPPKVNVVPPLAVDAGQGVGFDGGMPGSLAAS